MDPEKVIKEIEEWANSPEFERRCELLRLEHEQELMWTQRQIDRIHKRLQEPDANELLTKLVDKYSSDEYKARSYRRNRAPDNYLLWLLDKYADVHGRKSTEPESNYYGNDFSGDLNVLEVNDRTWYIRVMCGQGSVVSMLESNPDASPYIKYTLKDYIKAVSGHVLTLLYMDMLGTDIVYKLITLYPQLEECWLNYMTPIEAAESINTYLQSK